MSQQRAKATAEFPYFPAERDRVEAFFLTDQGPLRTSNQDSAAVIVPEDPDVLKRKGVLVLVADGMGGHNGGEIASGLAASTIIEAYYSEAGEPQSVLEKAFESANRAIYERARKEPSLAGMGTTCTAAVVRESLAYVAHVGDSRMYLVRQGRAYRMTEDHSATMELVNKGLLTLAEAGRHEDRNVILRALGTRPSLEVSHWKEPFPLMADDRLLFCSDGLHDIVSDDEIGDLCSRHQNAQAACKALIHTALERSCTDNVTAAVLHVVGQAAAVTEAQS